MTVDEIGNQVSSIIETSPRQLLIGGAWRPAASGKTLLVEDPGRATPLTEVADGDVEDALAAMDAAEIAQASWAQSSPARRAEVLRAAYAQLRAQEVVFARLIVVEMGKPLAEALGEVRYAADYLSWFADEALRLDGRHGLSPDGRARVLTQRMPVGVCVLVTPWNFPLAMGARKVAPAIAAGCASVIKPAQQTPLTMLAFARLLEDVGLPAGVVNVVTSARARPTVSAMLDHRAARKLSFTGSTAVGRSLAEHGGRRLLRMSLELGGNNPFLVFADADLDAAVDGAVVAKMRNTGQACTAANRFLVHERLVGPFAEALAERLSALRCGHGLTDAEVGPLIDGQARDGVRALVDEALHDGARLVSGGQTPDMAGYYFEPTVLIGPPPKARIVKSEIFGPIAAIQTFVTEDEGLAMANDTDCGLAAYIYTRDLDRAQRVVDGLGVGMVGVNRGMVSSAAAPFGGIKDSGLGREGGREGIDEYLSVKTTTITRGQA